MWNSRISTKDDNKLPPASLSLCKSLFFCPILFNFPSYWQKRDPKLLSHSSIHKLFVYTNQKGKLVAYFIYGKKILKK